MTDIVGNETLRSLWETMADRCANRDFMVFENRVGSVFEYTYAQFDEDVNRIANVFLSLDVQKGDFVALHLHSSPEFLMCLFGLAKIGAVAVPVNEQYLADETEYILDTAQVKCAVVEPLYLATYQELVKRGRRFEKGILVARAGQDSPVCDIEYP